MSKWDAVRPIAFMQPDRTVYPPSWLEHVPFAFWLTDVLRPRVFVELGTHSGNSYGALAQAVQHLGLDAAGYAIDTWKGDPQAGFYDESVFDDWKAYHDGRYSAFSTLVRSTFDEAVAHFTDGTIDLLNIDGYHTTDAVLHDFSTWLPRMSTRGVVLIHDINVREGDFGAWRAWEQLRSAYPSFAFLHGHGLGVLAVGTEVPEEIASLLGPEAIESGRSVTIRQLFAGAGAAILARYRVAASERESEARASRAQTSHEASRNALRTEIEALRTEIERTTCQLEHSRAERDRLVHDTQAAQVRADGQAEAAARRTASLEAERSALTNGIREWEQHATALAADRDRLQRELANALQVSAARAEEMKVLVEELANTRRSHSWRLTLPLRGTRRLIDKLWR